MFLEVFFLQILPLPWLVYLLVRHVHQKHQIRTWVYAALSFHSLSVIHQGCSICHVQLDLLLAFQFICTTGQKVPHTGCFQRGLEHASIHNIPYVSCTTALGTTFTSLEDMILTLCTWYVYKNKSAHDGLSLTSLYLPDQGYCTWSLVLLFSLFIPSSINPSHVVSSHVVSWHLVSVRTFSITKDITQRIQIINVEQRCLDTKALWTVILVIASDRLKVAYSCILASINFADF